MPPIFSPPPETWWIGKASGLFPKHYRFNFLHPGEPVNEELSVFFEPALKCPWPPFSLTSLEPFSSWSFFDQADISFVCLSGKPEKVWAAAAVVVVVAVN